MSYSIRFGVSIAARNDSAPQLAADFEARGFDLVLVPDHLFSFRDSSLPLLDGWMSLAAMTQTTHRVRLGTLVTNLSWRSPVLVAKKAIAIDRLSAGRFEIGIGCGRYADQAMIGVLDMPPDERVARLAEGAEVLNRLLGGDERPFVGRFTRYDTAAVAPGCLQQPHPPMVIAAGKNRALRVAARWADTWNCATAESDMDSAVSEMAKRVRHVDALCESIERDPKTLRRSLLIWPVVIDPWSHKGALGEIVDRFRPLGFSDFIVFPPPPERTTVLDHVTTKVLPALR